MTFWPYIIYRPSRGVELYELCVAKGRLWSVQATVSTIKYFIWFNIPVYLRDMHHLQGLQHLTASLNIIMFLHSRTTGFSRTARRCSGLLWPHSCPDFDQAAILNT